MLLERVAVSARQLESLADGESRATSPPRYEYAALVTSTSHKILTRARAFEKFMLASVGPPLLLAAETAG